MAGLLGGPRNWEATISFSSNRASLGPNLNGSRVRHGLEPWSWCGAAGQRVSGAAGQRWGGDSAGGTWLQLSVGAVHNLIVNVDLMLVFFVDNLGPGFTFGCPVGKGLPRFSHVVRISVFFVACWVYGLGWKVLVREKRKRKEGLNKKIQFKGASYGKRVCVCVRVCQARFVGGVRAPVCRGARFRQRAWKFRQARLVAWAGGKQKKLRFYRRSMEKEQKLSVTKDGAVQSQL